METEFPCCWNEDGGLCVLEVGDGGLGVVEVGDGGLGVVKVGDSGLGGNGGRDGGPGVVEVEEGGLGVVEVKTKTVVSVLWESGTSSERSGESTEAGSGC